MARTTDTTILRMFAITATTTNISTRTLTKSDCEYLTFHRFASTFTRPGRGDRTPFEFCRDWYEARGLDAGEMSSTPSQAGIARAWKVAIESGIIREAGQIRLRNGRSQKVYRFNKSAEIPSRCQRANENLIGSN